MFYYRALSAVKPDYHISISFILCQVYFPLMVNKKHLLEVFTYHSGGRGGIRTLGTFYRTPVFKTGTFNHSVTLPEICSHYTTLLFTNKNSQPVS